MDRESALAHEAAEHAGEERRYEEAISDHRDMTPALGTGASPGSWRRAVADAAVALHQRAWKDSRWSYLFGSDTRYATPEDPPLGQVAEANRRARTGEPPELVQGPVMKPPVWTWEVPLYFWFGGIAAGSSFVALACDLTGDERSARIARKVALAALVPCPPLLIADLGRPERFYNMLRIFKPRSPMSMGAWALFAFGNLGAAAVGADVLGRRRAARALGAGTAFVGAYLGSYTGVLLSATAVPVWARSRLFLGPIFVCTAAATGAAATRLVLVASGLPTGHPTREALGRVETGAMTAELVLSEINRHRLGRLGDALEEGRAGRLFTAAKWLVRAGVGLRLVRRQGGPAVHHVASACYLAAGLCFRFAWVGAGPNSARDDEAVARMARARATAAEPEAHLRVVHGR
jgi:formate-dependent nitrite reductase membrane component NrfD